MLNLRFKMKVIFFVFLLLAYCLNLSGEFYINDKVYSFLKDLCDDELIDPSFSPYWQANEISFDYYKKFYGLEYYPNSCGMASSLTTYTFFYSQYHQMLLSVASYIDNNDVIGEPIALNQIYNLLDSLRIRFIPLYNQCLRKHPHAKIYYERGMLHLHSGNAEEALSDIHELMKLSSDHSLTSEMFQQEGESYADLGVYDKAIASLTEAILRNPNNLEAYFHRAHANFESGNFEQALKDYVSSKKSDDLLNVRQITPIEFSSGLLDGLKKGGYEAAIEFFPSLWYSIRGLSQTIWATTSYSSKERQSPKEVIINFCNASYEMVCLTSENFRKLIWDTIEDYSYELKDFFTKFDRLSDTEKGQQCGHLIGKYGVDIFAGGATVKYVTTLKKVKTANKICNLEAMATSQADKEAIISSATLHAENRAKYFKNVKIELDKQNKHIPGKHNYEFGKSIFEHKDPQSLIETHAGTGVPRRGTPGQAGYRELVDFKEPIGIWKSDKEMLSLPATKGNIHYSKKGAHIVPEHPETKMW